jgi:hypothetical protein
MEAISQRNSPRAGDLYVIAPGEIVGVGARAGALAQAEGWAVTFPLAGLGPNAPDALVSWRAHPLLLPFARGTGQGGQRLSVPTTDRRVWSARLLHSTTSCGPAATATATPSARI